MPTAWVLTEVPVSQRFRLLQSTQVPPPPPGMFLHWGQGRGKQGPKALQCGRQVCACRNQYGAEGRREKTMPGPGDCRTLRAMESLL